MTAVRDVIGVKTSGDGAQIGLLLELTDGSQAKLDIVPEAVMTLVVNLINARTQAELKAQAGVHSSASVETTSFREPIPADKVLIARHPEPGMQVIQIMTRRGGVIEFEAKDSAVPWAITPGA